MRVKKDTSLMAIACTIGIGLIFLLSWQTDPNMKGFPLIPSWLSNWTDRQNNSTIRTAIPFLMLALLIGGWLYFKNASLKLYVISWSVLTGVVVLAEFGQFFIPSRNFDIYDIYWGSVGSLLGLALMYLLSCFTIFIRKRR